MTDPETRARELLVAFYAATDWNPNYKRPADNVEAAIRFALAALTPPAIPVDVADLCERLNDRAAYEREEIPEAARDLIFEEAATALETLAAENARLREEAKQADHECQAVWRCAIGDMVGALDVLKGRWSDSRRKADREAATVLSPILDLLWAYRDPAPANYRQAATSGLSLIDRFAPPLPTRRSRRAGVGDTISIAELYDSDKELARGFVARLRKLREMGLPPVLAAPIQRGKPRKDRLHMLTELDRLDATSKRRQLTDEESRRLGYLIGQAAKKEPRP